jgi:hypothetical protein
MSLMVRRRFFSAVSNQEALFSAVSNQKALFSAVSNHEARGPSFETRPEGRSSG